MDLTLTAEATLSVSSFTMRRSSGSIWSSVLKWREMVQTMRRPFSRLGSESVTTSSEPCASALKWRSSVLRNLTLSRHSTKAALSSRKAAL